MKNALIIVDMQNDFIDGALGTEEAKAIVPRVVDKIAKENYDYIVCTQDVHHSNYLDTLEGKKLPIPHCIYGTYGENLNDKVHEALNVKETDIPVRVIRKNEFGSYVLINHFSEIFTEIEELEVVGLCTDICVVSNALMLRSAFPDTKITVDASCCAGTTPENHKAALQVMKSCQIDVKGEQ